MSSLNNPFANLIKLNEVQPKENSNPSKLNETLERIFQITLDRPNQADNKSKCLVLIDYSESDKLLNQENIDEVLLQRLMINDRKTLEESIIGSKEKRNLPKGCTINQFIYLFWSYKRLKESRQNGSIDEGLFTHCKSLISNVLRSVLTLLDEEAENGVPMMSVRFVGLIKLVYLDENLSGEDEALFEEFFDLFMAQFDKTEAEWSDPGLTILDDPVELNFFNKIFFHLNASVIELDKCEDFSSDYLKYMKTVNLLVRSKVLKYLLVENSFLGEQVKVQRARKWQTHTILGKLLSTSVLPLEPVKLNSNPALLFSGGEALQSRYKYFQNPGQMTRQDVNITENNMHQTQHLIKKEMLAFFYEKLIKTNSNQTIRMKLLRWIGECLEDNKAKSQEWSNYAQSPLLAQSQFASDGFFLNLLEILLTASMPFCFEQLSKSDKIMKINFSYASAALFQQQPRNFLGFDKETKLIPNSPSDEPLKQIDANRFNNFITECYYATNWLFKLAFLSINQKLVKLNGELGRWQQTYQEIMATQNHDPQMMNLKNMFENMSIEFMNLKTVLLEQDLVKKAWKFLFNSSAWLSYLAYGADLNDFKSDSTPLISSSLFNLDLLKQPSRDFNLAILSQIPEYFITSIVDFVIFLKRFKESSIGELFSTSDSLNSFVSFILAFMGRADRVFNPHIRASLAEALESLLPQNKSQVARFSKPSISYSAFVLHPCASYVSEALLNVFVSIEMTGQSVQFEQKFNYRRPMYELIEYLWNMPNYFDHDQTTDLKLLKQHRVQLKELSEYALANLDDTSEQPLFLKFLNYLINDANYLLVEGLLYLEKIKVSQDKLAEDDVNKTLTSAQRSEMTSGLKHMIMLAKFHNFMSTKTMGTLRMLTGEIKSIFCHSILVDRVATMLNDFLLHLVGKKKRKNLKVKNFDEVEFKPKEMVATICAIYVNLASESEFCEAVCRDERSYSAELFQSAVEVLEQSSVVVSAEADTEQFKRFAETIEKLAKERREDDSAYEDAPDHFLDPIQFTLMVDPVILPSSKTVMDRSTIARHLLSDQTDPFNRSPLNLQDVIPATELKLEIENWKASKRAAK